VSVRNKRNFPSEGGVLGTSVATRRSAQEFYLMSITGEGKEWKKKYSIQLWKKDPAKVNVNKKLILHRHGGSIGTRLPNGSDLAQTQATKSKKGKEKDNTNFGLFDEGEEKGIRSCERKS